MSDDDGSNVRDERQTDRETDRERDRERDRETDRQRDRQRQRERGACLQMGIEPQGDERRRGEAR